MDLYSDDLLARLLTICQDERNHAAARPQLDHPLFLFDLGKPREQDGIDCESIPLLLLANGELAAKKGIAGQRAFLLDQIISSSWTRGFITSPEITFG